MRVRPKLFMRLLHARSTLAPVQSRYRIVYEQPGGEGAVCVVVPDPNWMAAALHGGVLPPVGVYHQLRCLWEHADTGGTCLTLVNESPGPGWRKGEVVNGHLLHLTHPIGPMTEEEAVQYLVEKDVPRAVWATPSNRPRFVICNREQIPSDRSTRDAWRLSDFEEGQAS